MDCRRFDECSAPLCPASPDSLKECYWFPDEEICAAHDDDWIRRQREIAQKAVPGFYFTQKMLARHCVIEEDIKGLDPEHSPDRQEAERMYQQLAQKHLDSLNEDYYARGRQRLEGLKRWAAGRAGSSVLDDELSAERGERAESPAP